MLLALVVLFASTTFAASLSKEPSTLTTSTQSSVAVTATSSGSRTAHRFASSTLTSISSASETTTVPTDVLSRRALLFRDVSYRTLPSPILTTIAPPASDEEGEFV